MIVGIDIRVLGNRHRSGIQEYAENLVAHMLPLDRSITYRLFYSSWHVPKISYPWLSLPNVSLFSRRIPNRALFWSGRVAGVPKLDRLIGGCDVFFSPHLFLAPLSPKVKRVTTFHDMSYERFPEFFTFRQRLWHRLEMRPRWQAQSSHRIIAVSDSTKHDLENLYHIDPAKITRIYSGVSKRFSPCAEQAIDLFRLQRGLPKRFFLFLGTLEPRKNIAGILDAFSLLAGDSRYDDVGLVFAGADGWLCNALLARSARELWRSRVSFVGHVPDDERVLWYNAATALLYPSFFEGFGFPPLEAMACGTPVIAAHTASLPEIVGSAGILVDPYRVSDIVHAMELILDNPSCARQLSQEGCRRAKQFSWDQCARETLSVLVH
jgi:glycosyltransferase involved in cell wall biosynthesis